MKHDEKNLFLVLCLNTANISRKIFSVMIVKDNLQTLFLSRYRKQLIRKQIEVNDIEEVLFSFRAERFADSAIAVATAGLEAQIQFSFS